MSGAVAAGSDRLAAFVLHRRPYRETSLLVDFLTRDGLLRAVCRGARGRLAGTLQPFCALEIAVRGRAELRTLLRAETLHPPYRLRGANLYCGMYLNEVLALSLRAHAPSEAVFDAYADTLQGLEDADSKTRETRLRRFEFQLFEALGYGLHLDHASDTGMPLTGGTAFVVPLEGVFMSRPPGGAIEAPVDVLQAILTGDFSDPETRRLAKAIARAEIDALVGGRPLVSRTLFSQHAG